jgi:hypothetical protein
MDVEKHIANEIGDIGVFSLELGLIHFSVSLTGDWTRNSRTTRLQAIVILHRSILIHVRVYRVIRVQD